MLKTGLSIAVTSCRVGVSFFPYSYGPLCLFKQQLSSLIKRLRTRKTNVNTSGNQTFVDKLTAIWESSSSFKWQRKEDKEDMQSMKKQKHGNETDVVPVFILSEP